MLASVQVHPGDPLQSLLQDDVPCVHIRSSNELHVRAGVRAVAALDAVEFHHATVFLFQQDVLVVQIL